MSGISRNEFIEMICERCHIGRQLQEGMEPAEGWEQECDCCAAVYIAGEICEKAGIE
jgi:hypothetical protein